MSSFGIRISPEGVDVKTGADKDMVMTSKYSMLKGNITNTGTIAVPRDGAWHEETIPHGLGYIPMVQAFFKDTNGTILNPDVYLPMSEFYFDGATTLAAQIKADATNIYLRFSVQDLAAPIIGYDSAGGSNIDFGSDNNALCNIGGSTFTAVTGDVCTGFSFYAKKEAADETVAVSLYTIVGGVPDTKVGTGGSVNVNSTTAQWWTVSGLSDALTAGVEYGVAFGGWGGAAPNENTQIYFDNTGSGSSSYNSVTSLSATWNENTQFIESFSLYATVERADVDIAYSYTIFIDKAKL